MSLFFLRYLQRIELYLHLLANGTSSMPWFTTISYIFFQIVRLGLYLQSVSVAVGVLIFLFTIRHHNSSFMCVIS